MRITGVFSNYNSGGDGDGAGNPPATSAAGHPLDCFENCTDDDDDSCQDESSQDAPGTEQGEQDLNPDYVTVEGTEYQDYQDDDNDCGDDDERNQFLPNDDNDMHMNDLEEIGIQQGDGVEYNQEGEGEDDEQEVDIQEEKVINTNTEEVEEIDQEEIDQHSEIETTEAVAGQTQNESLSSAIVNDDGSASAVKKGKGPEGGEVEVEEHLPPPTSDDGGARAILQGLVSEGSESIDENEKMEEEPGSVNKDPDSLKLPKKANDQGNLNTSESYVVPESIVHDDKEEEDEKATENPDNNQSDGEPEIERIADPDLDERDEEYLDEDDSAQQTRCVVVEDVDLFETDDGDKETPLFVEDDEDDDGLYNDFIEKQRAADEVTMEENDCDDEIEEFNFTEEIEIANNNSNDDHEMIINPLETSSTSNPETIAPATALSSAVEEDDEDEIQPVGWYSNYPCSTSSASAFVTDPLPLPLFLPKEEGNENQENEVENEEEGDFPIIISVEGAAASMNMNEEEVQIESPENVVVENSNIEKGDDDDNSEILVDYSNCNDEEKEEEQGESESRANVQNNADENDDDVIEVPKEIQQPKSPDVVTLEDDADGNHHSPVLGDLVNEPRNIPLEKEKATNLPPPPPPSSETNSNRQQRQNQDRRNEVDERRQSSSSVCGSQCDRTSSTSSTTSSTRKGVICEHCNGNHPVSKCFDYRLYKRRHRISNNDRGRGRGRGNQSKGQDHSNKHNNQDRNVNDPRRRLEFDQNRQGRGRGSDVSSTSGSDGSYWVRGGSKSNDDRNSQTGDRISQTNNNDDRNSFVSERRSWSSSGGSNSIRIGDRNSQFGERNSQISDRSSSGQNHDRNWNRSNDDSRNYDDRGVGQISDRSWNTTNTERTEPGRTRQDRANETEEERLARYETKYKPGTISHALRNAMGLKQYQLPPYIYKMRMCGYPPGWLENATEPYGEQQALYEFSATLEEYSNNSSKKKPRRLNTAKLPEYPGFTSPVDRPFDDEGIAVGINFSQMHLIQNIAKTWNLQEAKRCGIQSSPKPATATATTATESRTPTQRARNQAQSQERLSRRISNNEEEEEEEGNWYDEVISPRSPYQRQRRTTPTSRPITPPILHEIDSFAPVFAERPVRQGPDRSLADLQSAAISRYQGPRNYRVTEELERITAEAFKAGKKELEDELRKKSAASGWTRIRPRSASPSLLEDQSYTDLMPELQLPLFGGINQRNRKRRRDADTTEQERSRISVDNDDIIILDDDDGKGESQAERKPKIEPSPIKKRIRVDIRKENDDKTVEIIDLDEDEEGEEERKPTVTSSYVRRSPSPRFVIEDDDDDIQIIDC